MQAPEWALARNLEPAVCELWLRGVTGVECLNRQDHGTEGVGQGQCNNRQNPTSPRNVVA